MPGQHKDKKRANKRKALRLTRERTLNAVRKAMRETRRTVELTIGKVEENLVIQFRPGTFGHPRSVLLKISELDIAGAHDDPKDFGAILAKVGMIALAGLVNYGFEEGTDGLLKAVTKWAGIDIEALQRETKLEEIDEDGDIIVRTPEPVTQGDLAPGQESPT